MLGRGGSWIGKGGGLPSQVGNSGKYLSTDGSNAFWASIGVTFDPTTTYDMWDDFDIGGMNNGSGMFLSRNPWATNQSGSPAFSSVGATVFTDTNHMGVVEFKVAALNELGGFTSGIFGGTPNRPYITGGGILTFEAWVYINALSNGTDNGSVYSGIHNELGNSAFANGMYIIYKSATSANWFFTSTASSTSSTHTSAIPVTAGWHHVAFIVNAAGNSISYYIDTVLANPGAPVTTNIPTIALPPRFNVLKALGTGALYYGLDFIRVQKALTTPR